MQARASDPSLSAPLAGGLDVLTCIKRQPLPPSDRTMHEPEVDSLTVTMASYLLLLQLCAALRGIGLIGSLLGA